MTFRLPWLVAVLLAVGLPVAGANPLLPEKIFGEATARVPDFAGQTASRDASYAAGRVLATSDHRGQPFVIVDKRDARIFVFGPEGRLLGASAALLGLARGDHSVPGIGERDLTSIRPHERTTPAGRFVSLPGRNLQGEDVVWVNYQEGLAIHRLRAGNPQEQRAQRLASGSPEDNRISLGCVVVPVAFYLDVVAPILGRQPAVVYVLPEAGPLPAFFDALAL